MKSGIAKVIVTFFGAGLAPFAKGTFGSLAALPLGYLIISSFGVWAGAAASLVVLIVGTYAAHIYQRDSGKSDPGEIVIDEVAGQILAMCIFPLTPVGILMAFASFRFFDIIKPWPVSYFDKKVKNAFGVMMDDICAGAYPAFIILVVFVIFQLFDVDADVLGFIAAL